MQPQTRQRSLPPPPPGYKWENGMLAKIGQESNLSDTEQARANLMELAERRAREGEQFQQTPGELLGAQIDSSKVGIPLASEHQAAEAKLKRQTTIDKQRRLRELRDEIRVITLLLREKETNDKGDRVHTIPPGSEDRAEVEQQLAILKEERDMLEGKRAAVKQEDPLGILR